MKETFYFSHDYHARYDPKLIKLHIKYGLEGHGIYWWLIEALYEENGYLKLSEVEYLANAMRTDSERILSIINDFDLFEVRNEKFFSVSVLSRLSKRAEKSMKASKSARVRWNKDAIVKPSQCEGNAIKESKVKESKVKEKKDIYVNFEKSTLETWNSLCIKHPLLSEIKKVSTDRRRQLKKRFVNSYFVESWVEVIGKIPSSPFLMGANDRQWTISYDWLIKNDTNYLKVLENKYKSTTPEADKDAETARIMEKFKRS